MDKQFTLKLQEWMNTPADKRDYEQGAKYLLQLTNNKILFTNISRDLKGHAQFIEFKIKRYLQYRLQELTHEEVNAMQKQVDAIVQKHGLDKELVVSPKGSTPSSAAQEFRTGKRADHDTLPPEIQALYVENASLMQKMRELHLQLRKLSTKASTCPDSDRYPFLKEIIELDKRYHKNWEAYDKFTQPSSQSSPAGTTDTSAEATSSSAKAKVLIDESARQQQKNVLRQINLAKGRYKKNPSGSLKENILSLYKQLTAPSEALTAKLKKLGIL